MITYPNGGYTKYTYTGNSVTRPYYFPPSQPYYEVQAAIHTLSEKDQCGSAVVPWGTTVTPDPNTLTCPSGINKTLYAVTIGTDVNGLPVVNMSVTTPDGTVTSHANSAFWNYMATEPNGTTCCTQNPVERSTTTGSGNASTSVTTVFDTDGVHPQTVTTTLGGTAVRQVTYTNQQISLYYNGKPVLSGGADAQIWDVQKKQEYDYGTSSAGSLLRTTAYTWNTPTYVFGPGYFAHQKLTENVFEPGATVPTSQTKYEYDVYNHINTVIQASDAIAHGGIVLGSSTYNYDPTFTDRYNVTATSRWRNTDGAWLSTTGNYDDAGNVIVSQDPKLNTSYFGYSDAWSEVTCAGVRFGKAYLTSTLNPLGQGTAATYSSCTGTRSTTTDANGQTTQTKYDLLNRVTEVSLPDGGLIDTCYSENGGIGCSKSNAVPLQQTVTTKVDALQNKTNTYVLDGLDRVVEEQLNSDTLGTDLTDTTYDNMGRSYCKSNPYRKSTDTTYGNICQTYDALNRPLVTTEQDGAMITNSYSGATTTTTNEVGFPTSRTTDGLGRLAKVMEPDVNNNNALTVETDYAYNALDDLTQVDQWGGPAGNAAVDRQRVFSYDSLSQLTSSFNPESGTTTYSYLPPAGTGLVCSGEVGSACSRTDARNVKTTYSYDALGRVTERAFSGEAQGAPPTPPAFYLYDLSTGHFADGTSEPITALSQTNLFGRLAATKTGTAAVTGTAYSYDPMGRTVMEASCTPRTCGTDAYALDYNYDLAGDTVMASCGRLVNKDTASPLQGYYYGGLQFHYNAAQQLSSATSDIVDSMHPASMFSSPVYAPDGDLASAAEGPYNLLNTVTSPRGFGGTVNITVRLQGET